MKDTGDIQFIPRTSGSSQIPSIKGKVPGEDGIIKYMYNLPTYLEKGDNLQEKVLNVGVIDWGQLQKWQCNRKQIPHRSSRCLPSSSIPSPSLSTDGSPVCSSSEQRSSPHQRVHRPPPQTHVSKEIPGEGFQDPKTLQNNTSRRQLKFLATGHSSCGTTSEPGILPSLKDSVVKSSSTGKMKIEYGGSKKKAAEWQKGNSIYLDKNHPKRLEAVLILPKGPPKINVSRLSQLPDSMIGNAQKPTTPGSISTSSGGSDSRDCQEDIHSAIRDSGSLTHDEESKESEKKQRNSPGSQDNKFSSNVSPSIPQMAITVAGPGGKKPEKKASVIGSISKANRPSAGPDKTVSFILAAKLRSISPARRFNVGIGKISRNSRSEEDSAVPNFRSTHLTSKSEVVKDMASACVNDSSRAKQITTTRSRHSSPLRRLLDPLMSSNSQQSNTSRARHSSPLRRLLDPILKPKAVNSNNVAEPEQETLTSGGRTFKSFDGQQSAKVKLDFTGCGTIKVNNSCRNGQPKSSSVHALLKVAVKNGLPLFTFAVENDSKVLAATGGRLGSPRKDDCCWSYTFFTIEENKKGNGGWANQGDKGTHLGYTPNAVAQMKVSDSMLSKLSRHDITGKVGAREFVLYSVNHKQAYHQPLTIEKNDELAAIVINFPRDKGVVSGFENLFNMTVVLPNGVHTLPSNGEPSSLIQRWRSGGSCDCGGWDLGCKLTIIGNENQLPKTSNPTNSCPGAGQFDLFNQEEGLEKQPVFTLAPFKDGILSVEFDTSLSFLQAFSICTAVIDGSNLVAFSQPNNLFEDKLPEQVLIMERD